MSEVRDRTSDFEGLRVGPEAYRHSAPDEFESATGIEGFLDSELLLGFSAVEVGIGVVASIAMLVVLRGMFGRRHRPARSYDVTVVCPTCAWSGVVGRYNRVCKGCGGPV